MDILTIGMAAREAGVGVETIRFYERRGLLERPPKPSGAGIRRYPPDTVRRVRFIRQAQQLGFTLPRSRSCCRSKRIRRPTAARCACVRLPRSRR